MRGWQDAFGGAWEYRAWEAHHSAVFEDLLNPTFIIEEDGHAEELSRQQKYIACLQSRAATQRKEAEEAEWFETATNIISEECGQEVALLHHKIADMYDSEAERWCRAESQKGLERGQERS